MLRYGIVERIYLKNIILFFYRLQKTERLSPDSWYDRQDK